MPARYMLDTNICIFIRRRRQPIVLERLRVLEPGEAVISLVTYAELLYRAEKSRERDRALRILEELVQLLPIQPMTAPEVTHQYARVRADLERRGEVIGNNDLWIAAHALSADLTLVTSNGAEFRRVEGLRVEDWAAA
jgi:tRNA(fMet)-specific endonuclease VapC